MTDINRNQKLAIAGAVLGAMALGTAQLTDIVAVFVSDMSAARIVKGIVSLAALGGTCVNGVLAVLTGNAAMVETLSAVPGVEPIKINKDATPALAKLALDPKVENVEPAAGATPSLRQIATGDLSA